MQLLITLYIHSVVMYIWMPLLPTDIGHNIALLQYKLFLNQE